MSMKALPAALLCVLMLASAGPAPAANATENVGTVTKLPIPRFVSLRASQTNLREGPSLDHRISWVFKRAGQPVEIVAEFDIWRRIRDSDGTEGWVMSRVVSSRRTAVVAPWSKEASLPLYDSGSERGTVVARLQPNVLTNIDECDGRWCEVRGDGFAGWIQQDKLWGAYPGEKIK